MIGRGAWVRAGSGRPARAWTRYAAVVAAPKAPRATTTKKTSEAGTATISQRALGRATLARQMLLTRERSTVVAAVERLVGMQAQLARPPYVGLWTRLREFAREDLTGALERREVVRAPLMRCTLHLMSARDYLSLRGAIQPVLDRAMKSVLRERTDGLGLPALMAAARAHLQAKPRTFEALRDLLVADDPEGDARAMGYAVRCLLPLVQVPTGTAWGFPAAADFALADAWLGREIPMTQSSPLPLVTRYLAAFGPASVSDMQSWSGLQGLREEFEALRPTLMTFRDERGRELFDLPDAPRPPEEVDAPVRFMPDFDNLILGHDDRRRLIADEHRAAIFLPNLRVLPTFLVDGRVAGTWKVEAKKASATLVIEPFVAVSRPARAALTEEGEGLLRFLEPEAASFAVRVAAASAARPRRAAAAK